MKKMKKVGSITTFIGADANIEGAIEFTGAIRMDGKVKGRIIGENGTLIVGEKAFIESDIKVNGAIVMGEVRGTIDARERIEVYPPARIIGKLRSPVISIDSGAVFNGRCNMKGAGE